jgi:hypothetical protein
MFPWEVVALQVSVAAGVRVLIVTQVLFATLKIIQYEKQSTYGTAEKPPQQHLKAT